MAEDATNPGFAPSRRAFLTGACAVAVAGLAGAVAAAPAEAAGGIKHLPNGKVQVTVAKISALRKVGGVVLIGMVGEAQVAVVRTGQATYTALDLSCPHAGVEVRKSSTGWSCPAHGSQFSSTGTVQRGPARRNLATLKSSLVNGVLTVG